MIDLSCPFRLKPRWNHHPRSDSNPIGQRSFDPRLDPAALLPSMPIDTHNLGAPPQREGAYPMSKFRDTRARSQQVRIDDAYA